MKNTYTVVHAVAIFWFSVFAHAGEFVKPAPLPIEQMRATAYTKAFAKRFALPEPEPGTEPEGGIEAMEFSVEPWRKHQRLPTYACILKLYLDSNLPVAYPEEGVAGAEHMLIQPTHFFMWPNPDNKRWMSLREQDRLHFNERQGRYTRSAALASVDYIWRKQGLFADMFFEEYHRDIFSGLAYVKFDMGCPTAAWGERHVSLQIWIKKEGTKDYRKQVRIDSEDFLKFTLPKSFFDSTLMWIKAAAQYNSTLIDEQDRLRREAQAKKKSQMQN